MKTKKLRGEMAGIELVDCQVSAQAAQALIELARAVSRPSWMTDAEGKSSSCEIRREELRLHIVKLKWQARIAIGLCNLDDLEETPVDPDADPKEI